MPKIECFIDYLLELELPSDHRAIFCMAALEIYEAYEWITYSYSRQTEQGNELFKEWILSQDWQDIYSAESSDLKAELYQEKITAALSRFYPVITVKRKNRRRPLDN